MNYAEIKEFDIANGPGIRLSLFVSGCSHRCPGCFNQEAQDPSYGCPFTPDVRTRILEKLEADRDSYRGMTLLGGEPMEPYNQEGLLPLIRDYKTRFPEKDLWVFTGYLYDQDLLGWMCRDLPHTRELLSYIDVLVDGEFRIDQKDITLLYKGSANQRTIDVPRSLKEGKIIQWDPGHVSISRTSHL